MAKSRQPLPEMLFINEAYLGQDCKLSSSLPGHKEKSLKSFNYLLQNDNNGRYDIFRLEPVKGKVKIEICEERGLESNDEEDAKVDVNFGVDGSGNSLHIKCEPDENKEQEKACCSDFPWMETRIKKEFGIDDDDSNNNDKSLGLGVSALSSLKVGLNGKCVQGEEVPVIPKISQCFHGSGSHPRVSVEKKMPYVLVTGQLKKETEGEDLDVDHSFLQTVTSTKQELNRWCSQCGTVFLLNFTHDSCSRDCADYSCSAHRCPECSVDDFYPSSEIHNNIDTHKTTTATIVPRTHTCKKHTNKTQKKKASCSKSETKKSVECTECKKTFRCTSRLDVHLSIHTGMKQYPCSLCNKEFAISSALKTHMKIHTEVNRFKCRICGMSYKDSSQLNIHMTSHKGLKRHNCHLCPMAFARKGQLKLHLMTHTGFKPHRCSVCNQGFYQSSHLKRHITKHSGERPFPCPMCDKAFKERGSLRKHARKIHGLEKM